MSAESPESIAYIARPSQVEQPPAVLAHPDAGHITRAATSEELRAVELLFGQRAQEEGPGVAGLFFAYSAGMLLHDVLKDTFTSESREVEVEEEPKKKGEPE